MCRSSCPPGAPKGGGAEECLNGGEQELGSRGAHGSQLWDPRKGHVLAFYCCIDDTTAWQLNSTHICFISVCSSEVQVQQKALCSGSHRAELQVRAGATISTQALLRQVSCSCATMASTQHGRLLSQGPQRSTSASLNLSDFFSLCL